MMKTIFGALAATALLCAAVPASAQADGDYYTFDLYNGTSGYTILTFQTARPGGGWSNDWIPTRVLEAGDSVAMRFRDSEDQCVYWVRVTFDDGDKFEDHLDFCALETVIISDDGMEGIE